MFKFNFNNIESLDEPITQNKESEHETKNQHNYVSTDIAKEYEKVESGLITYDELNSSKRKSFVKSEITFKKFFLSDNSNDKNDQSPTSYLEYVDSYKLEIDEKDSLSKINKTHDLVAGQYEGGLKVICMLLF
jgi:hypothetical protein